MRHTRRVPGDVTCHNYYDPSPGFETLGDATGHATAGVTNREIALRLAIAPGTVRIHVERILGKLGLTSRVQVATWVVRAAQAR